MIGCREIKCPEEAVVGDYCIRHFKADHDRRRAERDFKRENHMSEKEPGPEAQARQKGYDGVKICRRCERDKSGEADFNKKRKLCRSCSTFIRRCEREGRPVPAYGTKPKRQKAKAGKKLDKKARKPDASAAKKASSIVVPSGTVEPGDLNGEPRQILPLRPPVIHLDFSDYPALKTQIEEMARQDFR
ncbi:MAG: hypothetical protein ACE5DW_06795, partial [Thermodesulfobacteriota bacterium]